MLEAILFSFLVYLRGDLSWSYWNSPYFLYPLGAENSPENLKHADPSCYPWKFRTSSTFQAGLSMQLLWWWAVGSCQASLLAQEMSSGCMYLVCNRCCKPFTMKQLRKLPLAEGKHNSQMFPSARSWSSCPILLKCSEVALQKQDFFVPFLWETANIQVHHTPKQT